MTIKLWHCAGSRSVRPLWALLEMGLPHEVVSMAFPPRYTQEGYLALNDLGTVPFLKDGETELTESAAMCLYLVERYDQWTFGVKPDHPDYGAYLNWLFHADATLTFPQTVFLRYGVFEKQKGLEQAGLEYADWFRKRLVRLEAALEGRDYLVANRFTVADIAIGYALYLADKVKILGDAASNSRRYLDHLSARPAFKEALAVGAEHSLF